MADESDPELLCLSAIWQRRFGEPPPIVTDAEMIRRVLDSLPPEPAKEVAWGASRLGGAGVIRARVWWEDDAEDYSANTPISTGRA